MKFTKMNGAGNDFIIIDNRDGGVDPHQYAYIARTLCRRRFSIGADGMMFVEAARVGGDYRMAFYNSDGSRGEMCGNGARCIARYGYEKGLAGDVQKIETTAGLVTGWKMDDSLYRIKLNDVTKLVLSDQIVVGEIPYEYAYVELGDPGIPHAVVRIEGLDHGQRNHLLGLGQAIRHHSAFPKGANVNFYDLTGENQVTELTFERGVEDFTYACGTGTAAVAAVLTLKGQSDGRDTQVHVPGGLLRVELELTDGKITDIYLIGPTNIAAEGEVRDQELIL